MTNYAYPDKQNILHVLDKDVTEAKKQSKNGKVVITSMPCAHGFPLVAYKDKPEQIVMYSLEKAVVNNDKANKTVDGKKIDLDKYPTLVALYKECM